MTVMYAPNDITSVVIPAEGGRGCGQPHERPVLESGQPMQPWGVDCEPCANWLRANDSRFVTTIMDIPETFDERRARENYEVKGIKARDSLAAIALARMAGISSSEIPPALTAMLNGQVNVPGITVCPSGHDNTPGSRFCRQCGSSMSGPASAGELGPGATA